MVKHGSDYSSWTQIKTSVGALKECLQLIVRHGRKIQRADKVVRMITSFDVVISAFKNIFRHCCQFRPFKWLRIKKIGAMQRGMDGKIDSGGRLFIGFGRKSDHEESRCINPRLDRRVNCPNGFINVQILVGWRFLWRSR